MIRTIQVLGFDARLARGVNSIAHVNEAVFNGIFVTNLGPYQIPNFTREEKLHPFVLSLCKSQEHRAAFAVKKPSGRISGCVHVKRRQPQVHRFNGITM